MAATYGEGAVEAQQVGGALRHLVRGGHAFDPRDKREAYHNARMQACDAVAMLLLRDDEAAPRLIEQAEHELLPALGGLVRRMERGGRRRER